MYGNSAYMRVRDPIWLKVSDIESENRYVRHPELGMR